jgi:tetratricopeptide (TPR) repeat protein
MLETIREYAAEQLTSCEEDERFRTRHAEHFAALAERLEPEVRAARNAAPLDLLEVEHDNLRAAIDWSRTSGRSDLGLRLTGRLWWFWFVRGQWAEAVARLDAALAAAPQAGLARANALLGRSLFRVWLGSLAEAETDGQEVLALAEGAGDKSLKARAVDRLALAAGQRGNYARATALHEEVAVLSRETDDDSLLCVALGNLADIALNEGDFERAVARSTEAVDIARRTKNVERAATSLGNLGSALLGSGRVDEANECFAESLRSSDEIGSAVTVGYALEGLGAAAAAVGDFEHSARLLGAADETFQALGTTPQTFEKRRRDDTLARLRAELGPDRLEAAMAEGRSMTPSQIAALPPEHATS